MSGVKRIPAPLFSLLFLIFLRKMGSFPEQMTVDETHLMVDEGKFFNFATFEEFDTARKFSELFEESLDDWSSQLYTQVDSGNEVAYLRGVHHVNRTGVYLVAWRLRLRNWPPKGGN